MTRIELAKRLVIFAIGMTVGAWLCVGFGNIAVGTCEHFNPGQTCLIKWGWSGVIEYVVVPRR